VFGRDAYISSMLKHILFPNIRNVSIGHGLILWYDLSNEKGHEVWYVECYQPVEGRYMYSFSQVDEGSSCTGG
jgi:hypothetical protein